MLQNKLHVFCCPFYRSFSLVCIVSLVFKLQFLSRIMKIFDYCFSVSPFILSRYGVFCNWSLSTSVSFRNKSIVSPECTNYIGGFGGMFHRKRKKKWKLDSRKRHTLHSLDRTQYVYFVELSVLSLVIHNSCALFSKPFQSQANCKLFHVKSLLISSQSECFLTVRFSFEYAILLILLARPSYFKQCQEP